MLQYCRIVVALDGSPFSDLAADTGLAIASKNPGSSLTGCHVYAAKLHRNRFGEMEPGLPDRYQKEETLSSLRSTHDDLISSGMQMISDAYIVPLAKKAKVAGVKFSSSTPEGRHYTRILGLVGDEKADLLVCGAHGHGKVPESVLGSVAERVILYAGKTDVLVMREPLEGDRPIVAGIDGSPAGFTALARAVEMGKALSAPVEAVAVFDPFFHTGIFKTIAGALPPEEQEKFDFPAQEQIHDAIIDRGLEHLYAEKLDQAEKFAASLGMQIGTSVLKGKIFPEILRYAANRKAGLIVLGRHGMHHEEPSLIGSNALSLSRLATGNVLLVAPTEDPGIPLIRPTEENRLPWTTEAEEILRRIPSFAQGMARRTIEGNVRSAGGTMVTPDAVTEMGKEMGMAKTPGGTGTPAHGGQALAERIIFRKVKRFAPDFHRHMLGSKIVGKVLKKGDRELVYEVDETYPPGPVLVTGQTSIEFR